VEKGCKKSLEALRFLTKFNNEYYRCVLKKEDPQALHKSAELYKDVTRTHNQRRRDLYSITKALGDLLPTEWTPKNMPQDAVDPLIILYSEEYFISFITLK
jgi:hypothetical protein